MKIEHVDFPETDTFYPVPNISGLTITIPAYHGRMGKMEFELVEDEFYTAIPRAEAFSVFLYAVRNRQSGEIRILVDEVSLSDPPVDSGLAEWETLQRILSAEVPVGASEFSSVRLRRSVKPSKESTVIN